MQCGTCNIVIITLCRDEEFGPLQQPKEERPYSPQKVALLPLVLKAGVAIWRLFHLLGKRC